MLATPADFVPLHAAQPAARTRYFVFRGDQVLLRASDLLPPEDEIEVLAALGSHLPETYPVGLHGDYYCCAAAVDAQVNPPDGFVFSGMRPLFGAMDERLLSIAGRAFQITEWRRTH